MADKLNKFRLCICQLVAGGVFAGDFKLRSQYHDLIQRSQALESHVYRK